MHMHKCKPNTWGVTASWPALWWRIEGDGEEDLPSYGYGDDNGRSTQERRWR
jgi:hypothetical protein